MVDRTLILRKLSNLEAYLAQIKEYQDISLDAYVNDWRLIRLFSGSIQDVVFPVYSTDG